MMEYIDYWYYYNPNEDFESELNINSTFFGYNVIYFRGLPNWMVENPTVLFTGDKKGIPLIVEYDGKEVGTFSAKPDAKKIKTYKGVRINKDKTKENVDDIRRADIWWDENANKHFTVKYKSSCGKKLTTMLGKKLFPATYYSWLMSDKNEKVDLGETLKYKLSYRVIEGQPQIKMIIGQTCSKKAEDMLEINGEKISLATLSMIADKLGHQQTNNKDEVDVTGVQWYPPTEWMDISDLKDKAVNITNAVYMWWGENKNNINDVFVYIGIVGARSENHSVCDRITEEMKTGIASEFGVNVKQFRYSMVKSSAFRVSEILKTVEMQCINNLSSIIPVYANGKETISSMFDSNVGEYNDKNLRFVNIGNGKRIILINKEIRYHNA